MRSEEIFSRMRRQVESYYEEFAYAPWMSKIVERFRSLPVPSGEGKVSSDFSEISKVSLKENVDFLLTDETLKAMDQWMYIPRSALNVISISSSKKVSRQLEPATLIFQNWHRVTYDHICIESLSEINTAFTKSKIDVVILDEEDTELYQHLSKYFDTMDIFFTPSLYLKRSSLYLDSESHGFPFKDSSQVFESIPSLEARIIGFIILFNYYIMDFT